MPDVSKLEVKAVQPPSLYRLRFPRSLPGGASWVTKTTPNDCYRRKQEHNPFN